MFLGVVDVPINESCTQTNIPAWCSVQSPGILEVIIRLWVEFNLKTMAAAASLCDSVSHENLSLKASRATSNQPGAWQRRRRSFFTLCTTRSTYNNGRTEQQQLLMREEAQTQASPLIRTPPPHQREKVTGWLLTVMGLPVHCGMAVYNRSLMCTVTAPTSAADGSSLSCV